MAVLEVKVVNRLELRIFDQDRRAFDEDSQTGFCSDAPLTLEQSVEYAPAPSTSTGKCLFPAYLRRHRAGAFGLAAALTFSLVAQESHTAAEESSSGSDTQEHSDTDLLRQRWRKTHVTVALDDSLRVLGPDSERLIKGSFATWEDTGAGLPQIEFTETSGAAASLKPDGQSTVLVAPIEFEGHESDLAITIGFSNPNTGEVTEADIVINSKHVFSSVHRSEAVQSGQLTASGTSPEEQESCTGSLDASACGASYDLANVLTHEVGHFFGLGENYNEPRSTMFSCTSACEIHKRDLEPADVDSMIILYIEQPTQAAVGCSGVQISSSPIPTRFGTWAGWFMLLGLGLWRRFRTPSSVQG